MAMSERRNTPKAQGRLSLGFRAGGILPADLWLARKAGREIREDGRVIGIDDIRSGAGAGAVGEGDGGIERAGENAKRER